MQSASTSAVVCTTVSTDWGVHVMQPNPFGEGRWCARCGLVETTCAIEGQACRPLWIGQKPYGSAERATRPADAPYGIIDPEYARIFTVARCIAWSEGYALLMHGSFTRDLDLLAVPWTEPAADAEPLVKRFALALDDLSILVKDPEASSQASAKPHGRRSWTLTFKAFGDPRWVDLGVMPRIAQASADLTGARDLVAANAGCRRPAQACGAGGAGTGACGCLATAGAILRMVVPNDPVSP